MYNCLHRELNLWGSLYIYIYNKNPRQELSLIYIYIHIYIYIYTHTFVIRRSNYSIPCIISNIDYPIIDYFIDHCPIIGYPLV